MIVIHHPECASYATPGHPERPARVLESATYLTETLPGLEWRRPSSATDEHVLLAHTPEHLARLAVPQAFDADTRFHEGIADIARLATGAALETVEAARAGHPAFSLMRPPGHHASEEQAAGFCYLNHIAIAALQARRTGVERVAIWDFDAHHGNGTEAIVRGRDGILFASVHQFPGYPGTGAASVDNCLNFPVLPDIAPQDHMNVLRKSLDQLLAFDPGLLLVSAGFDAFRGDPITTLCLERDDFLTLGAWLHAANRPTAAILEGGYSRELPRLITAFLEGWLHG